jgi:hypothetical protein
MKTDLLINELSKEYDSHDANHQLSILKTTITTLDSHRGVDYTKSISFLDEIFKKGLVYAR